MENELISYGLVFISHIPFSAHRNRSKQRSHAGDSGGEGPELLISSHEAGEGVAEADQSRSCPANHLQVDQGQHFSETAHGQGFR